MAENTSVVEMLCSRLRVSLQIRMFRICSFKLLRVSRQVSQYLFNDCVGNDCFHVFVCTCTEYSQQVLASHGQTKFSLQPLVVRCIRYDVCDHGSRVVV